MNSGKIFAKDAGCTQGDCMPEGLLGFSEEMCLRGIALPGQFHFHGLNISVGAWHYFEHQAA